MRPWGRICRSRILGARSGLRQGTESGNLLIELLFTVAILAVIMSMVMIIGNVEITQTASQIRQSEANLASQQALSELVGYVKLAVAPAIAQAADSSNVTSACWSTTSPGPAGGQTLGQPGEVAVIYAHDYDMEFCAYPAPGGRVAMPHIYELYVNMGACSSSVWGSCPLDLVDYGASWSAADYASPSHARLVWQVGNVWCDQACQTGYSCATYLATDSGQTPSSCGAASGVSSSCTEPDPVGDTPPLFTYCSATGMVLNSKSQPLDLSAQGNASQLGAISTVGIDIEILANESPKVPSPAGKPGADAASQVVLANVPATP